MISGECRLVLEDVGTIMQGKSDYVDTINGIAVDDTGTLPVFYIGHLLGAEYSAYEMSKKLTHNKVMTEYLIPETW
jgi:hypothetical protein